MSELSLLDGRYQLLHELGRGAFGSVHRAAHIVLGSPVREVAVKVFYGDLVTAENMGEKMNDAFQLIAILAELGDWRIRQHFLTVFDIGICRDATPQAYIVMELVSGGNLSKRIASQVRFTPSACLHYLRQISRAVGFMHQCSPPMVHSDLKPENILLFHGAGDDLVKIGDFGLAGCYRGPLEAGPRGGTLSYLAPEMFYDLPTTPSADVFSLGLIGYEMLTGANPFADVGSTLNRDSPTFMDELQELHKRSRKNPLVLNPNDFRAGTGDMASLSTLVDVVNCMLEIEPSRRYRHAQEVSGELERIAAGGFALGKPGVQQAPPPRSFGDAKLDSLIVLQQQFAYALDRQLWPEATDAVRKLEKLIMENAGERDMPFRLRAKIFLGQANASPAAARPLRTNAARELERGLGACMGTAEQARLAADLAGVRKELGIE